MKLLLVVIAAAVCGRAAEAKRFDFKSATFATYVRGAYGASLVGGDAYANSSGAGTVTDLTIQSNYSGEFGALFGLGGVNLRFAGELLIPATLGSVTGSSSSGGATMFTLDSKLRAVLGMASLEIVLSRGANWKLLAIGGGGYGWVTLDNKYTMTAAGTSASGLSDFTESAAGSAPAAEAALAAEFLFTDAVTIAIDAGYRYMRVNNMASTSAQTTFVGSKKGGDSLVNGDGSARSLDLGGPFAGLSLRFYL